MNNRPIGQSVDTKGASLAKNVRKSQANTSTEASTVEAETDHVLEAGKHNFNVSESLECLRKKNN